METTPTSTSASQTHFATRDGFATFSVDTLQPKRVYAPKTAEEVSEVLRQANAEGWSVVPFGSGSKQHIGNPLKQYDVALSLENFSRIPEYEPQDLVVKVESGCPLGQLQARLAADGLCLAVDPASGDNATLGGIVSCHDSGPLRFAHGTIRDYLIGISLVQPDGSWTKFGSRVVKNVTGYDMGRLYTGAFGTLGVLLDFFFKLKPLPPSEKSVVLVLKGLPAAAQVIDKIIRSPLVPAAVEFLNPAAVAFLNLSLALTRRDDCCALVVRFGDVEKAVQWQVEQLERLCAEVVEQGTILSDAAEQAVLWRLMREDRPWLQQAAPLAVKLKINCLPNRLVETVQQLESWKIEPDSQLRIKAHAGSGVIRAYMAAAETETDAQRFRAQVHELRSILKPYRGAVIVESAPLMLRKALDVWGYDFKDRLLMRQIRQKFDPRGILNPGRFVV